MKLILFHFVSAICKARYIDIYHSSIVLFITIFLKTSLITSLRTAFKDYFRSKTYTQTDTQSKGRRFKVSWREIHKRLREERKESDSENSKEEKINNRLNDAPIANGLRTSSSEKAHDWSNSNDLENVMHEKENAEEPQNLHQSRW